MTAQDIKQALKSVSSSKRAKANQWFFKAGKGQYGEGDKFIGVRVPQQREVAKRYKELPLEELSKLFASPVHEHRLCACFISVYQYQAAKKTGQELKVYSFFLKQLKKGHVNNWDLIDSSVPQIIGDFLLSRPRDLLYEFADSGQLWQQRAAIMATQSFIKQGDYGDTLVLAERLLHHPHDLIHKAVGWMLREVGNRDRGVEEAFLARNYKRMPRTMLRYSIEKFPDAQRRAYLEGKV